MTGAASPGRRNRRRCSPAAVSAMNTPANTTSLRKWPPCATRTRPAASPTMVPAIDRRHGPVRHDQCRRVEHREHGGRLAAHERTVACALIGRQQRGRERLATPELDDLRRTRAPPLILEQRVGDEPRPDAEAENQVQPGDSLHAPAPRAAHNHHKQAGDRDAAGDDEDGLEHRPQDLHRAAARTSETTILEPELAGRDKVEVGCERERDTGRDADEGRTDRQRPRGIHAPRTRTSCLLRHHKPPARPQGAPRGRNVGGAA